MVSLAELTTVDAHGSQVALFVHAAHGSAGPILGDIADLALAGAAALMALRAHPIFPKQLA